MPELPRVAVLLSTYRESPYLAEQLCSVFLQQGVEVVLCYRQDDAHPAPLMTTELADARVRLLEAGPGLGVAASFLRLLALAPTDCVAYAFCDQDDFWHSGKLRKAVAALSEVEAGPALYLGGHVVTNALRHPLRPGPTALSPGLTNALIENQVPGCCMVLNLAAQKLLARSTPSATPMHDWWAYLVISALGRVINDSDSPGMDYRQHADNVVGDRQRSLRGELRRIRARLVRQDAGVLSGQASELLRLYGSELSPAARTEVQAFLDLRHSLLRRLRYLLSGQAQRHGAGGGWVWKLQFLTGLF